MKKQYVMDLTAEVGDGDLPGILNGSANGGSRLTWPETSIPRSWWALCESSIKPMYLLIANW